MDRNRKTQNDTVLTAEPPVEFGSKTIVPVQGKNRTAVHRTSRQQRPAFVLDFPDKKLGEIVSHQVPVTLPDTATVYSACCVMRNERIGAVLVTGAGGRLVGLFTGRDVTCRVIAEALDPATTPLYSVMTVEPDALSPEQRASDALRMMNEGGYRHLPIVDGMRVLGIVSRDDLTAQYGRRSVSG